MRRAQLVQRYYDKWGWIYPLIWGDTIHWGLFDPVRTGLSEGTRKWSSRTIRLLLPHRGRRFLEIGCGPATTAHRLISRHHATVDAIDISDYQLARARAANRDEVANGTLRLTKGDIADLKLPSELYDGAYSEAVFFHVFNKLQSLKNVQNALHRGARFVYDDLIIPQPGNTHDVSRAFTRFGRLELYTLEEYERMFLEVGFVMRDSIPAGSDLLKTYEELLDSLEELHMELAEACPDRIYRALRVSFKSIIALLRKGRLDARLFVLEKG